MANNTIIILFRRNVNDVTKTSPRTIMSVAKALQKRSDELTGGEKGTQKNGFIMVMQTFCSNQIEIYLAISSLAPAITI